MEGEDPVIRCAKRGMEAFDHVTDFGLFPVDVVPLCEPHSLKNLDLILRLIVYLSEIHTALASRRKVEASDSPVQNGPRRNGSGAVWIRQRTGGGSDGPCGL